MSVEQTIALLGAVTALLVALGAILQQIIALRHEINGRVTQLLELTQQQAHAAGHLAAHEEMVAQEADRQSREALTEHPSGE